MRNYLGGLHSSQCTFKMVRVHFVRVGEKGNKWVQEKVEQNTVDLDFYRNFVEAIPFFKSLGGKEIVEYSYTEVGYIPTKITSISPGREIKKVTYFDVIC